MENKPSQIIYNGEIYERVDSDLSHLRTISATEREAEKALKMLITITRDKPELHTLANNAYKTFEKFSAELTKLFKANN